MTAFATVGALDALIRSALAEDLQVGDLTSRTCLPLSAVAHATILARQRLVVAGGEAVVRTYALVDPAVEVSLERVDGENAIDGDVIAAVSGPARSVLAGERVALNLLARASGVATCTRSFVDAAGGGLRICDTRKTMPGLRALDRHAVRCGGGYNHRNDLGTGVLIKENHIRICGSVRVAVQAVRAGAPHAARVECEVTDLEELEEALDAGVDAVLLDNMADDAIEKAVKIVDGGVIVEVSGGVTLERIPTLAGLGVDVVSVGALTHSAPGAELTMLVDVD